MKLLKLFILLSFLSFLSSVFISLPFLQFLNCRKPNLDHNYLNTLIVHFDFFQTEMLPLIHSLKKYLLNACHFPGTEVSARAQLGTKDSMDNFFMELRL